MYFRKSTPIAAAFLTAIISLSSISFAGETWYVTSPDHYVDPNNAAPGMSTLLDAAKTYLNLPANKNETLVVHFPSGTYDFISNGVTAIAIDGFNPDDSANGRLVLRGDGLSETILKFNRYDQQGIRILDSNRITIEQMHLTRDAHYVSQGDVVSVEPGKVWFQVHEGFPDPEALFALSLGHADGDSAQRTLLGFRGSDLDPELDPSYPAVLLSGMNGMNCESNGLCEATLKRSNELPPWPPGQHVAFRSKVGGNTIFVTNSDDVIVQDVRFTRMSLGPIRFSNGCDGPILRRVAVDRSDDVMNGRVPFFSSPGGGPQIDTFTRGPTIQDCTIVGTGDDGIAVFTDNNATTPTSGILIEGNTVRDNQARGILLNGGDGNILGNICRNNTLIRNEMASIVVGQVSNDWDIVGNTFIQPWIDPVIMLDGSDAILHQNIRIFNNWFFEAPKNSHLIHVNKTNNLEIYNNTIISFSNEEDYNEDLDPAAHTSPPPCLAQGTCNSLVHVTSGLDVQGWGNTYPQGTSRVAVTQQLPTDNVNVEWSVYSTRLPIIVPVAEDTYLNSNAPNAVYGNMAYMRTQRAESREMLGLVKFNVNGVIAAGDEVLSAKLKVPVYSSTYPVISPGVYACSNDGWSETTVTYNNKPTVGEPIDSKSGTFNVTTTIEFDVTSKVENNGTYSFYLWNATNDLGSYATKENAASGGATLEITTYTPGDNPPVFVDGLSIEDNATQDVPYVRSLAHDVYDIDGDIYDSSGNITGFSKLYGPSWLEVSDDGRLSGTPSNADAGENVLIVRVTDTNGNHVDATITITVIATTTFQSVGSEDGYVRESSPNSEIGGTTNASGDGLTALRIGDDANNQQMKAFVSFNTSSIPEGATILSATLRLKRGLASGNLSVNPLEFGTITVDIQSDNGFSESTTLQPQDFQASTSAASVATLPYPCSDEDWSEVSLASDGLAAINKTGSTQLRFGFEMDDNNNETADYLGFYSGDNSTAANRPQLVVVYH